MCVCVLCQVLSTSTLSMTAVRDMLVGGHIEVTVPSDQGLDLPSVGVRQVISSPVSNLPRTPLPGRAAAVSSSPNLSRAHSKWDHHSATRRISL